VLLKLIFITGSVQASASECCDVQ